MKRILKITALVAGVLVLAFVGFLFWAYAPVPTFKPVVYEPAAVDHWPTQDWKYSTPEDQGMNSETLVNMMSFCEESLSAFPTGRSEAGAPESPCHAPVPRLLCLSRLRCAARRRAARHDSGRLLRPGVAAIAVSQGQPLAEACGRGERRKKGFSFSHEISISV